jgi:hypothetical protein
LNSNFASPRRSSPPPFPTRPHVDIRPNTHTTRRADATPLERPVDHHQRPRSRGAARISSPTPPQLLEDEDWRSSSLLVEF